MEIKIDSKGVEININRIDLELINIGISQVQYIRLDDVSVLFISAVKLQIKGVGSLAVGRGDNLLDTVKQ